MRGAIVVLGMVLRSLACSVSISSRMDCESLSTTVECHVDTLSCNSIDLSLRVMVGAEELQNGWNFIRPERTGYLNLTGLSSEVTLVCELDLYGSYVESRMSVSVEQCQG